ncbi:hypothetical protein NIES4102_04420 [Chondrocystis sp. NIES-4102]|nr:hypothetical protein NIES4102_04420 [Chondrocystis sp. NIES-4102]
MNKFSNLKNIWQQSQEFSKQYIVLNREEQQLILKEKTLLLLCKQAENRIANLVSLQPEATEGMIAVIETDKVEATLHFTPEKISIKDDYVEGELRLLSTPKLASDSMVYRYLIAGWQTFLGSKIPAQVLPKDIRVEQDKVYYSLPKDKLELLKPFLATVEKDSTLSTTLKNKELTITSSANINWENFKIQDLIQLFLAKK